MTNKEEYIMKNKIEINNTNLILDKIISYKKEKRQFLIYNGETLTKENKTFFEKILYYLNRDSYLNRQIPCNKEYWSYVAFDMIKLKLINGDYLRILSNKDFVSKINKMNELLRGINLNYRGMFDDYRESLWGSRQFHNNFIFCENQSVDQIEEKLNKYFS
jgi:hypothetical protein